MSANPNPTPRDDEPDYYRRALHHITDITLDLADLIHAQAKSLAQTQDPNPLPALTNAAAAIDRLSRAVRNAVTAKHLDDPAKPSPAQRRAAVRKQILRDVEDAIHRSDKRPPDQERLHAELIERLDSPDLDDDIDTRPADAITAELCRDLGLANMPGQRWKRRTPADVAALRATATRPPRATPPPPNPAQADDPERLFRLLATPNGA